VFWRAVAKRSTAWLCCSGEQNKGCMVGIYKNNHCLNQDFQDLRIRQDFLQQPLAARGEVVKYFTKL
jgi:hypothetical protein